MQRGSTHSEKTKKQMSETRKRLYIEWKEREAKLAEYEAIVHNTLGKRNA
jgi:hypothetical protein